MRNNQETVVAFRKILESLAHVFDVKLTDERAMLYFGALEPYEIDAIRSAAMNATRTLKFFPRPAELIEIIAGTPDDRALTAWTRVETALRDVGTYQSVDFGDAVLHAVIEQMGGWAGAWTWERLEEKDYGFKRLEFTRLYRLFEDRGVSRPLPSLAGQAALANRQKSPLELGEHRDEVHVLDGDGRSRHALPPAPVAALPAAEPVPMPAELVALARQATHDTRRLTEATPAEQAAHRERVATTLKRHEKSLATSPRSDLLRES